MDVAWATQCAASHSAGTARGRLWYAGTPSPFTTILGHVSSYPQAVMPGGLTPPCGCALQRGHTDTHSTTGLQLPFRSLRNSLVTAHVFSPFGFALIHAMYLPSLHPVLLHTVRVAPLPGPGEPWPGPSLRGHGHRRGVAVQARAGDTARSCTARLCLDTSAMAVRAVRRSGQTGKLAARKKRAGTHLQHEEWGQCGKPFNEHMQGREAPGAFYLLPYGYPTGLGW